MDKIPFRGCLWIASDIHLGETVPETARAFYEFLSQARSQASALILCGDIFDTWIGDDHALKDPPPWLAQALHELSATAHALPLWLVHGNRDFLMGEALADALGARLLDAPAVLDTEAGDVLLAHGDEYCVEDHAYQRFRRLVHTGWIQRTFLALPLGGRRAIARWARSRSQRAHHRKSSRLMDVTPAAIEGALRDSGCRVMVHGHTHRPAMHELQVDGEAARRFVLPDWEYDHAQPVRGGWICVDAGGIHLQAASMSQTAPTD